MNQLVAEQSTTADRPISPEAARHPDALKDPPDSFSAKLAGPRAWNPHPAATVRNAQGQILRHDRMN